MKDYIEVQKEEREEEQGEIEISKTSDLNLSLIQKITVAMHEIK